MDNKLWNKKASADMPRTAQLSDKAKARAFKATGRQIAAVTKLSEQERAQQVAQKQQALDANHPVYVAAQAKLDALRESLRHVRKPEKKIRLMKLIDKQTALVYAKGQHHHRTTLLVQAMRDRP